jgi:hypothetical protein
MKLQELIHILIGIVCIELLPNARAVSPAPDGGYPGGNTAEGQAALLSLTTGGFNTAVGFFSLRSDTTGQLNTALGAGALLANTAEQNTATGAGALLSNTTGDHNTANGAFALFFNTTGHFNMANGDEALYSNTIGSENTACDSQALTSNTTGNLNIAVGFQALLHNTTGSSNTALGADAGNNVITANNVICIGAARGGADVDNTCFIGSIFGVTTQISDAMPVLIDDAGQLGTANSSRRYKTDIKPIDKASESILKLKPVSFRYKIHKDTRPQFGLIAEEVAEMNPDLVICDADGKPYTVRYEAVNAMLLNEFLKAHRKMEEQDATIMRQQKQIDALTSGLQKVSAQLEASKPAPELVNNP